MKKLILCIFVFCAAGLARAQEDSLNNLLLEAVALHDKGDYDGALRLYDQVIAKDPKRLLAWYEKSLTLLVSKRYEACIDLCKEVLGKFKEGDELDNIYVNYGSALDAAGKPEEAIMIYSQGIRKYNHYLLFFNRGITEFMNKKNTNAINDFQQTLLLKPLHASSHQYLSYAVYGQNKVASMMGLASFLVIESNTIRSDKNLKILQELFSSYAKKTGDNQVTISMSPHMLDLKDSNPDNFSIAEMTLALSSATDFNDTLKQFMTPADKMKKKLGIFADISTVEKKGFFTQFYVSFFRAMQDAGHLETAANLILARSNDDQVKQWLSSHEDKLKSFSQWLQEYKWTDKVVNK
ncbi:tetratricopeptide repeat protein [Pseudobacter ginsenosidimutans]|uniref:Tetratricopeptide repeat protein n=1 Tax=Pseudobacter ginsenosidimutans TaxID=661488 RepID=A0A4Q7N4A8_9BACT|nr:tetratricopeptide repeat protein [Pseudobacter ginsenosidimutans]QEC44369.1 tetratricopeptide repeat protein [Pseudobacter ginsenosidimutans]RZS75834.1 tetratricopeptide repeat protein [Pseudobacter ginsenosidimutans]